MTRAIKFFSLAAALFLIGCSPGYDKKTTVSGTCDVRDFGGGVFFFDCAYNFGEALVEFRKTHEVVSVTSYASGDFGTSGYWVVVKP